jgi:hypothetical protein
MVMQRSMVQSEFKIPFFDPVVLCFCANVKNKQTKSFFFTLIQRRSIDARLVESPRVYLLFFGIFQIRSSMSMFDPIRFGS